MAWTSPAFFIPKPNPGKGYSICLITDLSKLNRHIVWPIHPFPSVQDIIGNIKPSCKVFTKVDAIQGYHQVALDEPSSYLTTFLLPCGWFHYLCTPMGLCSLSNEWCWHSDVTIENILGICKLVNDYLVASDNIDEVVWKIHQILQKCHEQGLTISKRKFEINTSISFTSYNLSPDGIRPDPSKISTLTNFPKPKDMSLLQSFLGMANQLCHFIPNLAAISEPLCILLKKNTAFLWLEDQENSFSEIKMFLSNSLSLQHFDPKWKTYLITNASKLHGLGFMLIQSGSSPTKSKAIIQCRSCSLSPYECNYKTIELECLAMAWASTKCNFFIGDCLNFEIVTNHCLLLGIFTKPLSDIANPHIIRLCKCLLMYQFNMTWLQGKANLIANDLSHHPMDQAQVTSSIRSYLIGPSNIISSTC